LGQESRVLVHVDSCLPPDTPGLTATASSPSPQCEDYFFWALSGATLTAGQGTQHITFTSGPPGTLMTFAATGPRFCGTGHAAAETSPPTADATGSATICPGLATRLIGSGGATCEWTPTEGLDDPNSCSPMAGPSGTTTYSLAVTSALGCVSTNDAAVTVTVAPEPRRDLIVDRCLPPNTPGLLASLPGGGESYLWQVSGGTITSGQATDTITFTSGPVGTSMRVAVELSGAGCTGFTDTEMQVDFDDVPPGDIFYGDVCAIGRHGITAGCGGGDFCRDASVRRDQMAVFLLKARHRDAYQPPACSGIFNDVACPGPFTDWVEQLWFEEITAGCGELVYCPSEPVSRAQMAVFLLKTEHGAAFVPSPCAGAFEDVPCPGPFTDWIEALRAEEITAGCQASPLLYCPGSGVTRGQMAVFLVKTFHLQ